MALNIPEIESRVNRLTQSQRLELLARVEQAEQQVRTTSDQARLVAWVVSDGSKVDVDKLRHEARLRLTDAQVPFRIEVVDQLPRTSSGKVDKKQLVDSYRMSPTNECSLRATDEPETETTGDTGILLVICQRLLKMPTARLEDSFSELGGDSLLSIQLVALAREQGILLKPADVLGSESIAELARMATSEQVEQTQGAERQKSEPQAQVPETDLPANLEGGGVTTLRLGQGSGSLLFAHDIGGNCSFAQHLFEHLTPELTFFVSSQIRDNELGDSDEIQSLASAYVDRWLELDPIGPHYVVSYCWGALLGYEIAVQFEKRGQTLETVAMIDFGTEASYQFAPTRNRLWDLMRGYQLRVKNRLDALGKTESLKSFAGAISRKLYRKLTRTQKPLSEYSFEIESEDTGLVKKNVGSYFNYPIKPATQKIALFRTSGSKLVGTRYVDRTYGWRYLVGDRVTVYPIPGTHNDCIMPPQAELLAREINRVLRPS